MTGTKIVKLRLEDGGAGDKLPELRGRVDESVLGRALEIFETTEHQEDRAYHQRLAGEISNAGLDIDNITLQAVVDTLEKKHADEKYDSTANEIHKNIGSYQNRAGLLYTALVQASSRDEFKIKMRKPVNFLGHVLDGKKIIVDGDVGHKVGWEMKHGEIIVNGNAGMWAGMSKLNGNIHIKKNAGKYAGSWARAGEITVDGDTDAGTGQFLCGGRVTVMGDAKGSETGSNSSFGTIDVKGVIENISPKVGATIYEKGIKKR
ncbi:MAG: hypothetical protein V1921_06250 [Candidatus Altiarchaeota archaeon]